MLFLCVLPDSYFHWSEFAKNTSCIQICLIRTDQSNSHKHKGMGTIWIKGGDPTFFFPQFFGRNLQAFLEELCRNFYNFGDFRVPPPPRLPHTSMLTQRNGDIYCIAVLKNLKILQVWNFFKSNTVFAKFVYILCQEYFLTSYLLY